MVKTNRSICLLIAGLILAGCNRDESQTVDTSVLSAPSSPQSEDTPSADSNAAAPPAPISQAPVIPAAPAPISYQLPAGWTQQPGADMRFATLNGPEHMQIAITVFPGDVGGTLANINRWRRQMDLPAIAQEQLNKNVRSIPTSAGPALLADLSNHDQRMLAAMLPIANQTWFLKMTGATKMIDKYNADFMAILKSVTATKSVQ